MPHLVRPKIPKDVLTKKTNEHIANKKYGVFQTDSDFFEEVATKLGLQKRGKVPDMSYIIIP